MLPEKVCILCVFCKSKAVIMSGTEKELKCACGNLVKNPYYKEPKVDNTDLRPEEKQTP